MRRIVIAVMGTISTLVMLFAFDASHRSDGGATTALGTNGAGSGSQATGTTDDSGTLGSGTDDGSDSTDGATATDEGTTPAPSSAAPAPTTAAGTTKKAATGTKTYTGDAVMTRWGPVQVQITVKNGKITNNRAVVYPDSNGHDIAINGWALPVIHDAVIQAQSANFDNVSGATVTTDGYKQSLQSALDKAHL